jgi:hypothetical protein
LTNFSRLRLPDVTSEIPSPHPESPIIEGVVRKMPIAEGCWMVDPTVPSFILRRNQSQRNKFIDNASFCTE